MRRAMLRCAAAMCALSGTIPAGAEPRPEPSADTALPTVADAYGTPLSAASLDAYRGGETLVAGTQTLTSTTTGNVLTGGFTAGSVTLSDSALSNFSGVGNFAINTGAQVSLQSGMNLTINVGP